MKSLFDILLGDILKGEMDAKKAKKKTKNTEVADEEQQAKTLKEQAEAEVKRRAKKKLEEAFAKSERQTAESMAMAKRRMREMNKKEQAAEKRKALLDSLQAPTKRFQWQYDNTGVLQAFHEQRQVFSIERGASMYKMYLSGAEPVKGVKSLADRARGVGVGNNYTSTNVYQLKEKAEKVLSRIELLEKQARERTKKKIELLEKQARERAKKK
jgi:hypothetical protein